jgi:hypothetical protein
MVGEINCHIRNKDNLERLLNVVKILKIDICGVVETWVGGEGKEKMEERLSDTDFVWVGKGRKGRKGGGVGFLRREKWE